MKLLDHHVLVEPIQDDLESEGIILPDQTAQFHVSRGWVLEVSDVLEESIAPGDFIVFQGWKEARAPTRQYEQQHENLYSLHEDDIDLVVEEW